MLHPSTIIACRLCYSQDGCYSTHSEQILQALQLLLYPSPVNHAKTIMMYRLPNLFALNSFGIFNYCFLNLPFIVHVFSMNGLHYINHLILI